MKCDEISLFLQDYATLSEDARGVIDRHLTDCASCAADRKLLHTIDDQLRAQNVLEAPGDLVARAMQRLFPAVRPSFRREFTRIAAAAVLLLGITSGLMSFDVRNIVGQDNYSYVEENVRRPMESGMDQMRGWTRLFSKE